MNDRGERVLLLLKKKLSQRRACWAFGMLICEAFHQVVALHVLSQGARVISWNGYLAGSSSWRELLGIWKMSAEYL